MKFVFTILLYLPVCVFGQDILTKTIKIEPYLSVQNYEHFKRFVLNSDDPYVEFIDGFDFEWGYFYELEVQQKKIPMLSDGTQFIYSLNKIKSKLQASDSLIFPIAIDPHLYYQVNLDDNMISNQTLEAVNDSVWIYMDEVELQVPLKLRKTMAEIVEKGVEKRAKCKFINQRKVMLLFFY